MRYFLSLFLVFSLVCVASAAKGLRIKSNGTPIYKAKTGESSKGTLSQGDMVTLLKKGKDRSLVKTNTGVRGWVKNNLVEYTKKGSGDVYNLNEQDITGWLDNPSAIYILDESGINTDALPLSRSFSDEIFEIQDREELERGNDEN
ncbi:MAG: hypothetical protein HQK83_12365 [Fibrobacteria bacterium]|nr:hypothetical protein [Fibrobacteria bacterium]